MGNELASVEIALAISLPLYIDRGSYIGIDFRHYANTFFLKKKKKKKERKKIRCYSLITGVYYCHCDKYESVLFILWKEFQCVQFLRQM